MTRLHRPAFSTREARTPITKTRGPSYGYVGKPRGRRPTTEPVVRFLRRVEVDPDRLCWIHPVKSFFVSNDMWVTTRQFAFMFWRGEIPADHEVLPRCGTIRCVNPDHLTSRSKTERDVMKCPAGFSFRRQPWMEQADPEVRAAESEKRFAAFDASRRLLDRSYLTCDAGHWVVGDNATTLTASNGEVVRKCKTCREELRAELMMCPDPEDEYLSPREKFRAALLARRAERRREADAA